jgi:transposase
MKKQDGRKLDRNALEERRRTIIRMKESGASENEILAATGCSRQVIYKLWNQWRECPQKHREEKVIKVKAAGTKHGERRKLAPKQETAIQNIIKDKYPDQLKMQFALWTREAVMKLIAQKFGITVSIRAAGDYLKRWGFTPQKPAKRAYERDPEKVGEWLKNTYPAIKKKAKRAGAEIYWCDEAAVKTADVRGRGYAPKGRTPVVERTAKKDGVGMISAITNQGKVLWKLFDGSITAERVLEFAKRLVKNRKRKIYLILDNYRAHRGKLLTDWARSNRKKIELYYLPPYSPDLNPDEYLNADVKYGVGSKQPKRTKEDLRNATEEHLNMLKKNPKRVKRYFLAASISYAA